MKNKLFPFLFLSLIPFYGVALNYKPWNGGEFERYLQLEGDIDYTYAHFNGVNAKGKGEELPSKGDMNLLEIGFNFPVLEYVDIEMAVLSKESYFHSFYFDSFQLMAKVPLLDDIQGDVCAFSLGAVYLQNSALSLLDLTAFHHGLTEGEFFFSIGKEIPFKRSYFFRTFFKGGYALSSRGSPYVTALLQTEWNFCDSYKFYLKGFYLEGLGKKDLHHDRFFQGYKNIRHQNIDLACGTKIELRNTALLSFEILRRLYVKNGPSSYTAFSVHYTYPFSI